MLLAEILGLAGTDPSAHPSILRGILILKLEKPRKMDENRIDIRIQLYKIKAN